MAPIPGAGFRSVCQGPYVSIHVYSLRQFYWVADAVDCERVLLSASEEKEANQEIVIVIDEVKTSEAGTDAAAGDEQSQGTHTSSHLQPESQHISAATGERDSKQRKIHSRNATVRVENKVACFLALSV